MNKFYKTDNSLEIMKVHLLKTILAPLRKPKNHLKTITPGLSSFTKALCLLGILTTTIGLSSCKKDPVTTTQTSETTYAWWEFDGNKYESKTNFICSSCKTNSKAVFPYLKVVELSFTHFLESSSKGTSETGFEVQLYDFDANKKEYEFNTDVKNYFSFSKNYTIKDSLDGGWTTVRDSNNEFTLVAADTISKRLEFRFNLKLKKIDGKEMYRELTNGHIIVKY